MLHLRYGWILALGLSAAPLTGQERPAPPDAPGAPPALERLERLRFERMQEALKLNEVQMQTLRENMEAVRRAQRDALEQQRQTMERLRQALQSEPVEEEAVRRALEALETQRETMERQREGMRQQLEQSLTAEQRAKLLLFNRQFDDRLRALMDKRRSGHAPGAGPGSPRGQGQPGLRGPRGPLLDRRHPAEDEAARLRQQIEHLQRRLEELERERGD